MYVISVGLQEQLISEDNRLYKNNKKKPLKQSGFYPTAGLW